MAIDVYASSRSVGSARPPVDDQNVGKDDTSSL